MREAAEARTKMRKAMTDMPDERITFGTRNIDVLLQSEEPLLKNWALMMQVPELEQKRRP